MVRYTRPPIVGLWSSSVGLCRGFTWDGGYLWNLIQIWVHLVKKFISEYVLHSFYFLLDFPRSEMIKMPPSAYEQVAVTQALPPRAQYQHISYPSQQQFFEVQQQQPASIYVTQANQPSYISNGIGPTVYAPAQHVYPACPPREYYAPQVFSMPYTHQPLAVARSSSLLKDDGELSVRIDCIFSFFPRVI